MSTETPRTDRMIRHRDEIAACEVVAADLARTIERELTAAQQEIERLQALILRISEAYDATIAEQAKEIERLRAQIAAKDEAIKRLNGWLDNDRRALGEEG